MSEKKRAGSPIQWGVNGRQSRHFEADGCPGNADGSLILLIQVVVLLPPATVLYSLMSSVRGGKVANTQICEPTAPGGRRFLVLPSRRASQIDLLGTHDGVSDGANNNTTDAKVLQVNWRVNI